MDDSEQYYLGDLLTTAGFPYIEIAASNKKMAYECILTHEVVTKRVVVLDDLRKGLTAVTYLRTSLADLANEHISIRKLVFPDKDSVINLDELMRLVEYDIVNDNQKSIAKDNMDRYLEVLSKRGKF